MDNLQGSIIAFEGRQDLISTQLRLLPTSSQILILPGIESYLPPDTEGRKLEPRTFIRKLHDAAKARNLEARDFLEGSADSDKRLVFMNGGTSQAHALCLKAIMDYETKGDAIQAEAIFKSLLQKGVTELHATEMPGSLQEQPGDYYGLDDPVTRAMRAAETLDRLTAGLQPSTELDLSLDSRPRSSSLPLYGYSDEFQDSAPFFVFGVQQEEEEKQEEEDQHGFLDNSPRNSRANLSRFAPIPYDQLLKLYESPLSPTAMPSLSPFSPASCASNESADSTKDALSPSLNTPWSDIYSPFSPRTPQHDTSGEAVLAEVQTLTQTSIRKAVKRTKSLDRVYASGPKFRDPCLSLEGPKSDGNDGDAARWRPSSCMVEPKMRESWNHESNCIDAPRMVLVKNRVAKIDLAPVPSEKKGKTSGPSKNGTTLTVVPVSKPQPLLPFTENLVIYFRDEVPDSLLKSVIDNLKDGTYSGLPSMTLEKTEMNDTSLPQTPQSPDMYQRYRLSVVSEEPSSAAASDDEYDPFAYTRPGWPQVKSPRKLATRLSSVDRPPTPPALSPTLSTSDQEECFHDFHITSQQSAVNIQNALRSILNVYFPPIMPSDRQFQSLLPETESSVDLAGQDAEPDSPRRGQRKMDQIIAIGAQREVSKAFTSSVVGKLEKLGTSSSGLSRSGKLDFRNLLANAMQSYTARPLASQTCDNPFNNPYLLATLIVPHLETYMALHPEQRYLLLEYPPEHLATVLSLQKLVGVDLMKVAQIVDANNSERLPFTHIRGASMSKNTDGPAPSRNHKRSASSAPKSISGDVKFTKANFLLTSTANESEIETFITTVLNILLDASPFYKPLEKVKKPSSPKQKAPSSRAAFSPYPRVHPTTGTFLTSVSTVGPRQSLSQTSARRPSLAETVSTSTTRTQRRTQRPWDMHAADRMSAFTLNYAVDQDLRKEERRLMPMYLHKPSRSEGSSKKAMKFLGLS